MLFSGAINGFPVYRRSKVGITAKEILQLCIDGDLPDKNGPFYLTTVTFPNPMFVYKNNESKHPTTLAAVMTSVSKETRDYEYLARSLKSEGIESLTY